MYGLPQSGLLANELLENRLNKHGYAQSKFVPGLWKHKTRPIQFCLTVDDFGVKYVRQEHDNHLLKVLQEHYKVTCDWSGTRYIGIHMHWDYDNHKLHLFMPGYVKKALTIFQHKASKAQNQPFLPTPIKYGAKKEYAKTARHLLSSPKARNSSRKFAVNSYSTAAPSTALYSCRSVP